METYLQFTSCVLTCLRTISVNSMQGNSWICTFLLVKAAPVQWPHAARVTKRSNQLGMWRVKLSHNNWKYHSIKYDQRWNTVTFVQTMFAKFYHNYQTLPWKFNCVENNKTIDSNHLQSWFWVVTEAHLVECTTHVRMLSPRQQQQHWFHSNPWSFNACHPLPLPHFLSHA